MGSNSWPPSCSYPCPGQIGVALLRMVSIRRWGWAGAISLYTGLIHTPPVMLPNGNVPHLVLTVSCARVPSVRQNALLSQSALQQWLSNILETLEAAYKCHAV